MKTKLNKSILFKQGNAGELFESFIQKVDENAKPNQLEEIIAVAKPQVIAPVTKNTHTKQFEIIVSTLLTNKSNIVFTEKNGKYFVNIKGTETNLDDILANMQRSQINLSTEQLNQYANYVDTEAGIKVTIPDAAKKPIHMSCQELKGKATKLQHLHEGEIAGLNIYTQQYYEFMNGLLRGQHPYKGSDANFQENMRQVILHSAAALSGISKGQKHNLPLTFRYDGDTLPKPIIEKRIQCAQSKGIGLEVYEDTAFVSSAFEKPVSTFNGPIRTVFYGMQGLDIGEISRYPAEREFLIAPGKVKYLHHREENKKHYFLACSVTPPASIKQISNLPNGGTYKQAENIAVEAERDMVKKFAQFAIDVTNQYLEGKAEKDKSKWSILANIDNTYGKGSYKIQFAEELKTSLNGLLHNLQNGYVEHKAAHNRIIEILHQAIEKAQTIDNISLSYAKGQDSSGVLSKTLQYICFRVEDEMKGLETFKSSITEYFAEHQSFFESPRNIEVIDKLHKDYLSKPYDQSEKNIDPNKGDWTLNCGNNKILHRPNHGLSHTLRGAALVPEVLYSYATHSTDKKTREMVQNLSKDDIKRMQVAMLFSVVGRKSELGFNDNKVVYGGYRQDSAKLFEQYAKTHYKDLFTSPEQIAYWKYLVLDYGNPTFQPHVNKPEQVIIAKIMRQCHCLDLLRCYPKEEFAKKVTKPLQDDLGVDAANNLINYSKTLLEKTGDRLISMDTKGYNLQEHWLNNTDVSHCINTLNSASQHAPHQQYVVKHEEEESLDSDMWVKL
ncbi:TPA: SidE phosphodiesterase domain-containing protein [Legionella pneumophila]